MDVIHEIYSEVLFGLSGIHSSCIYQRKPSLRELLPPAEFVLLERVANVGEKFCEIRKFIEEKRKEELRGNATGQYLLSLAHYLEECVEPYRQEIVSLQDLTPSLSTLYSRIYPYDELLKRLVALVREINLCQIRGTAILETLDKYLNENIGAVRIAVEHIHQGVSKLLLAQLLSWLLYGDLVDTNKEFFIQATSPSSTSPFEKFTISQLLLPRFIRPEVADKILIIGQTVCFLRSQPDRTSNVNCSGIIIEQASEISKQMNRVASTRSSDKWKLLESVVESVKKIVYTELHSLAMKEANLVHQLHMIKDLFLMGRGELFHVFVTQIDSGKNLISDLNLILRACAQKLLISEETLQPFSFEMVPTGGTEMLSIRYSAPWPLDLLFTPKVIESYNHIFRFLLRLKRIQVKMVASWLREKSKRKLTSCAKRRQLQHNLWFLVNNLQYYMQLDVLDSQFVTLIASVTASKDFDEIRLAHARFLSNLTLQSFLDNPVDSDGIVNPVQQRLNGIIQLCEEFCLQVERSEDKEMSNDVVHCLGMKFDACFNRLFALLAALKNHSGNPCCQHLGQFLLRLDFNRFLSTNSIFVGVDVDVV